MNTTHQHVRRALTRFLGAAALLTLTATSAFADVPGFVPVQGHLADAEGTAVDGEVSVVLRLYADEGGGSLNELWASTRTVTVENGSFTVYLGTDQPLDLSIFGENASVMLGMTFGEDTEMPLIEIGSVPYAAYCEYSADAATVAGMAPGELGPLAGLSCTDGQVATYQGGVWGCAESVTLTETEVDQYVANNDYVVSSSLAAVATSGAYSDLSGIPADIADGDDDSLAALSCSSGQVAQWTGAAWSCADVTAPNYTASAPIQISGTNISLAPDGITGGYIAPETITDSDISQVAAIAPTKIAGTAATLTGDQSFDTGTLYVDSTNDRVGVGTTSPAASLHVAGDVRVDGDVVYDVARTGAIQVSSAAFQIRSGSEDEEVTFSAFSGYLFISGGATPYGVTMVAPVDLPHGATVTDFACYAYDSSSTNDLSADVDLRRRAVGASSAQVMGTVDLDTTGVSSTAVFAATAPLIADPVVDNTQYNYLLDLSFYSNDQLGSSMRFYGCTIEYETTSVLH